MRTPLKSRASGQRAAHPSRHATRGEGWRGGGGEHGRIGRLVEHGGAQRIIQYVSQHEVSGREMWALSMENGGYSLAESLP